MNEQESSFLRWNLFLVKVVEVIKEDLEYNVNLVNKAAVGLKRIDSHLEESATVGKMLSDRIVCYREIFHEGKSQLMWQSSLSYFLTNCHSTPTSTTTPVSQ